MLQNCDGSRKSESSEKCPATNLSSRIAYRQNRAASFRAINLQDCAAPNYRSKPIKTGIDRFRYRFAIRRRLREKDFQPARNVLIYQTFLMKLAAGCGES
jgi:hypothetical protein